MPVLPVVASVTVITAGMQGPAGPQGPTGPAGAAGAAGPQGPAGTPGANPAWTIKTFADSPFTAAVNTSLLINSTGGVFVLVLPLTPSANDMVRIRDYAGTFGTNKCTIDTNGAKLEGAVVNQDITEPFAKYTLTYVDATRGWILT